MNAKELRGKKPQELAAELLALYREQFNLRMQKGTGQLSKPDRVRTVRRAIARVKTVIHEMNQAASGAK